VTPVLIPAPTPPRVRRASARPPARVPLAALLDKPDRAPVAWRRQTEHRSQGLDDRDPTWWPALVADPLGGVTESAGNVGSFDETGIATP